jgi:GNAT superfamily N-acetyltransferase
MAVWLVELDGRPVGFLGSGPPHDPDVAPPAGEVYSVYLLPEVWRLGLGRRLMETAVEHWRAAGARSLVLWVMTANSRARAFYEALGWRPDGATQEFALGDEPAPELRYRLEVEG